MYLLRTKVYTCWLHGRGTGVTFMCVRIRVTRVIALRAVERVCSKQIVICISRFTKQLHDDNMLVCAARAGVPRAGLTVHALRTRYAIS